jgi:translation initiation factor IF-2
VFGSWLAEYNVRIFTADIIYHLFDQFTAYMKQIKAQEQEAARLEAVFPCTLQVGRCCCSYSWGAAVTVMVYSRIHCICLMVCA